MVYGAEGMEYFSPYALCPMPYVFLLGGKYGAS
jgi:hypothetical protein